MHRHLDYKRVFGPSFVLGLVVLLAIAATATGVWLAYWLAATLLLLELYRAKIFLDRNWLSGSVLGLCVWLVLHSLLIAPVFKPAAIFAAWFLGVSFLIATRSRASDRVNLGKVVAGIVVGLAIWGSMQHWLGIGVVHPEGGRAHAWLESPNTLASVINVALLPMMYAYLRCARPGVLLLVAVLLLGLIATQSRGGWLAWVVGLFVMAFLMWRSHITVRPVAIWSLVMVLFLGVTTMLLPVQRLTGATIPQSSVERIAAAVVHGDTARRTDLYEIARRQIMDEPWIGQGYLSFRGSYRRSGQVLFGPEGTHYVHNDYLQIWLETGVLGLVALLGIGVAGVLQLWRTTSRAEAAGAASACWLGGALASVAAHAITDFPLYTPVMLVLVGLGLGGLQSSPTSDDSVEIPHTFNQGALRLHVVLGALFSAWLFLPAAASTSAAIAYKALSRGEVERALDWYTVARVSALYNAYYYWTLGVVWSNAAVANQSREAAIRADQLFAQGAMVDPNDELNPAQRLKLHRDHAGLLPEALSGANLVVLAAVARDVWPQSVDRHVEYVRTLAHVGQPDAARIAYRELTRSFPGSASVEQLAIDLGSEIVGEPGS